MAMRAGRDIENKRACKELVVRQLIALCVITLEQDFSRSRS